MNAFVSQNRPFVGDLRNCARWRNLLCSCTSKERHYFITLTRVPTAGECFATQPNPNPDPDPNRTVLRNTVFEGTIRLELYKRSQDTRSGLGSKEYGEDEGECYDYDYDYGYG